MNYPRIVMWLALTIFGVALLAHTFSAPGNQLLAAGIGGFCAGLGFTMLLDEVR